MTKTLIISTIWILCLLSKAGLAISEVAKSLHADTEIGLMESKYPAEFPEKRQREINDQKIIFSPLIIVESTAVNNHPQQKGGPEVLPHIATIESLKTMHQPAKKKKKIVVLQFNLWQEGTVVPGGFEAIVNEIERSDADFVTLSEVRNYQGIDFTKKLVGALEKKGKKYYSFMSEGSGLISKYEIQKHEVVYPLENDRGSVHKIITQIGRQRVAVYTAHLDFRNYACYLPRGYDGLTWKKLPAPVTDTISMRQMNLASFRDEAIRTFIQDAESEIRMEALVFLGGDFNEPSHLDWTDATKNLYDHNGVVYQWDLSTLLYQSGFIDAYRQLYPSPVSHPGFTFPSDNKDIKVNSLTWAPTADERERIDFIYYYPNKNLSLLSAEVLGPDTSIIRSERIRETSQDIFIAPKGVWPTDHKAVISTFLLKK